VTTYHSETNPDLVQWDDFVSVLEDENALPVATFKPQLTQRGVKMRTRVMKYKVAETSAIRDKSLSKVERFKDVLMVMGIQEGDY
jgi:hypothetical protein